MARAKQPDQILMVLVLPVPYDIRAIRQVKDDSTTTRILIIAMSAKITLYRDVQDCTVDWV